MTAKDKLLLKDGEKQGAFCHRLLVTGASGAAVRGYATGASLHEHTGLPVAVCIDAETWSRWHWRSVARTQG